MDSRERTHRYWHISFWFVVVVVSFYVLRYLAPVLGPVVTAAAMAYLLDPLVDRLARRGLKRSLAAAVVLGGFFVVILGALAVLVPLIAKDLGEFGQRLPELVTSASLRLEERFGVSIPDDWGGLVDTLRNAMQQAGSQAGVPVISGLARAVGSLFGFIGALLGLMLIPMFAFYFLVDWPRLTQRATELIPPRRRAETREVLAQIDERLSHWVRGQLTAVAILAALYATALSIIGIPLAIPIGLLAGLLSVIPYVGNIVGFGLAAIMALLDWQGLGILVAVGGVFVVMNLIEGFVLTPLLVGAKVGLSEAGALFAVLAGGHLLGFVGLMLAIPMAAAVDVLVRRAIRYYERSEFFTRGQAPTPEEAQAP